MMDVRIDLKLVKDISKPVDLLEKKKFYIHSIYNYIQRSRRSVYSSRYLEPIESAQFELILPTYTADCKIKESFSLC